MEKIGKIELSELDSVMNLIGNAIKEMEKNGIHQWDTIYPDRTVITRDIETQQLFCLKHNGVITGIMVINEEQPFEYNTVGWNDNGRPLVIHRLCIDPGFQGKGLAKTMVQFAEEYARKHAYSSIRLDAFTKNVKALGLYDSLHYERRGISKFRKGDFYCYEKSIV